MNEEETKTEEIVIDDVDFNELVELEKMAKAAEEQTNKIAGTITRLTKDVELAHAQEKQIFGHIEAKRKELIRRYKLGDRAWKIDVNTKKVVYS